MQLCTLLALSAALSGTVDAKSVRTYGRLAGRAPFRGEAAQDAAGRIGKECSTGTLAASTISAESAATTVSDPLSSPSSATVNTIDVDPNFDFPAATLAEQVAAAAATSLAAKANSIKVASLMTAATAVEKLDILGDDNDWKFDFNTEPAGANGLGGTIVTANLASFPVTQMTGSSMAIGVMGPCGFATPHSHPRANELNLVTQGTLISTMTLENGARVINQTVGFQQMTVFPQGSMHMEFNPGCTNATFVAAFTNADAGVQQSMTAFTNFGDQVIQATMGGALQVDGQDVDVFKANIPVNVALGVESCLAACGIKKRSLEESVAFVRRRGLEDRAKVVQSI